MNDLSSQDLAAIQDVHNRWIKAELNGDYSQVVDLCTDDIVCIPPTTPPLTGKPAIAAYLSNNTVELKDIQAEGLVIDGTDSIAYLTSTYHTSFTIGAESHLEQVTGTHLWILRKTGDGSWRVAIVTWSSW